MQTEKNRQNPPAEDRRSGGAAEPDPNREQRTGETSGKLGKSIQQEDRK